MKSETETERYIQTARYKERERERERKTERKKMRKTNKQHTRIQGWGASSFSAGIQTNRDGERDRQTETEKQTDRDGETDRQRDMNEINVHVYIYLRFIDINFPLPSFHQSTYNQYFNIKVAYLSAYRSIKLT